MSLRIDSINDLPPALRAQAEKHLKRQINQKPIKKQKLISGYTREDFESDLEFNYYLAYVLPGIQSGAIVGLELHKTFELWPAEEYCGLKLPKAEYTPDFFITYKSGSVEVVEVKHKKIRKLQRDYIYRRRQFIEKYAKPNGWRFTESITE